MDFLQLMKFSASDCRSIGSRSLSLMDTVKPAFEKLSATKSTEDYIKLLAEFVAIKGVSQQVPLRSEVVRTADWVEAQLKSRGGDVTRHELGPQANATDKDGNPVMLPPIITGAFGDPSLPQVLAYCHYDVQPALKADGWATEPFELTVKDGKMFGRGSTDDKGPIVCWLWVLDALKAAGLALPCRLVLCFEGMEENGSLGMKEWIARTVAKPGSTSSSITPTTTVITDSYWLAPNRPCVTHALRGNCYFTVKVEGPGSDLHSGVHGGPTFEPMVDLTHVLASLVTPSGEHQIEGLLDGVKPMTDAEKEAMKRVAFDANTYATGIGLAGKASLRYEGEREKVLLARWRRPTVSIHGIEGAFYEPGAKTVIPGTVVGKFSIRTVPNMEADQVVDVVQKHCAKVWAKLGSPNKLTVECVKRGPWFYEDPTSDAYAAACTAVESVWGQRPDLTCEGGSIPIASMFREASGGSVVLLPLGACDDGAHAQNEKMEVDMFVQGAVVCAAFLFELAGKWKA